MKKLLFALLCAVMVMAMTACGSDKKESSTAPETSEPAAEIEEEEESPYYVEGDTMVAEGCTIKITDHKVLQPGEGSNTSPDTSAFVLHFDMTNTGEKDLTPAIGWGMYVTVKQGDTELESISLSGEGDAMVKLQPLAKDASMSSYEGFGLADATTPVTLVFQNGLVGDELGTMEFEVQ